MVDAMLEELETIGQSQVRMLASDRARAGTDARPRRSGQLARLNQLTQCCSVLADSAPAGQPAVVW